MIYSLNGKDYACAFQLAIDIFDGKWKGFLLWYLKDGVRRNGELMRLIPNITQKMLTQKLRELENEGIVERIIYPVVPPKVEYKLTPIGKTLIPILKQLYTWGEKYAVHQNANTKECTLNS